MIERWMGLLSDSMAVDRVGWTLLHSVWEGVVAAIVVGVLLRTMKSAASVKRYAVASAGLTVAVGVVVGTFFMMTPAAPMNEAAVVRAAERHASANVEGTAGAQRTQRRTEAGVGGRVGNLEGEARAVLPVEARVADLRARLEPVFPWVVGGWALGVMVLSVWHVGGWVVVQRLRVVGVARVEERVEAMLGRLRERLGVSRVVRIGKSVMVGTPVVIGHFRPMILVPASVLTGLSAGQLEAILSHELAHIRRHDYMVNLLQTVVETLLFYHPAVWWISRQIREEREHCCDDLASAACGDRVAYVEALLCVEELRAPAGGLAMAASGGVMLTRVQRLLGVKAPEGSPKQGRSASLAAVLLAVGLLALPLWQKSAEVHGQTQIAAENQISGDVVGADGKPVEGAEVIVPQYNSTGEYQVLARARSGPDGKFMVEWGAKSQWVYAYVPGVGISASVVPEAKEAHLKLQPAVDVEVTLEAPGGTAAEGLMVRPVLVVLRSDGQEFPSFVRMSEETSRGFSAKTDARGKCVIHGLPRDAMVRFDSGDPRYARIGFYDPVALNGEGSLILAKPIRLVKAATITGQLLNPETSKPLAEMEVGAQAFNTDRRGGGGRGVTDAQGRFVLDRMLPGNYVVALRQPEERSGEWVAAAVDVKLVEGGHAEANFKLTRGGILKGQVRDAATKKGVIGINVGLYGPARPDKAAGIESRTVDAEGHFEFRVPPGEQHPYLSSEVPEEYVQPSGQAMQNVMVREGETVTINFDLAPDTTPVVEGTVVTADGKPAARAVVEYVGKEDAMFGRKVKTDAQGRFHLHAKPGTLLRARMGKLATATPTKVVDGASPELQLEEQATFTLIVHMTDETGNVVPGATAELVTDLGTHGLGSTPRSADAEGNVRFESLPMDGKYGVSADADGYGLSQKKAGQPVLDDPREVTLSMILHKATMEIGGTVVDENGKVIAGVKITLNGSKTGLKEKTTDAEGKFLFHVVRGASGLVSISTSDGTHFKSVDGRAGDTDLKLVMPKENATP